MEVDSENSNEGDGRCSGLRVKITDLERNLMEEKERNFLLQSQSDYEKLFASQEVDKYKRECLSLRDTVTRLSEDCKTMRERELRDQESIEGLLEAIERKDREFAEKFVELKVEIRDLECGKRTAQNEVDEGEKKCGECGAQVSKLVKEIAVEFERKERELKVEIRALECEKKRAQNEVDEWKKKCGKWGAQITKNVKVTAVDFEKKERELKEKFVVLAEKNRDLEHEVQVWMKRYEEALRILEENCRLKGKEMAAVENRELEDRILKLVDENIRLIEKEKVVNNVKGKEKSFERSRCNIASEVNEELPKRTLYSVKKSCGEDFLWSAEPRRKRVLVMVDSESVGERGGHGSDVEEDQVTLSQFSKEKPGEVTMGAKKDFGSSLNHSSGTMESSRECSASLQPSGVGSTRAKETYVEVADGGIPSTPASKIQEKSNRSPRPKKKYKCSDLRCSLTPSSRGSSSRNSVADKGVRAYRKRNFKKQIAFSEKLLHAVRRAETLKSNLKSCNPSFIKPMVQSHVSGSFWLGLPRDFCDKNLPSHELKMILEDEKGSECEVKYIDYRYALSGGWRGFALGHNLELEDTLIFELREPTRFKVYIIKANQEESPDC